MPYELVARAGTASAWAFPDNPGQPELGPFKDEQGRDIDQLIANGDVADLGFVPTFRKKHGSRFGDLLWTSCEIKVASVAFINALSGFSGWRSYPIQYLDRKGNAIEGYMGFAVEEGSGDVFHSLGFQHWSFGISDEAMDSLRDHGVTGFIAKKIQPPS